MEITPNFINKLCFGFTFQPMCNTEHCILGAPNLPTPEPFSQRDATQSDQGPISWLCLP